VFLSGCIIKFNSVGVYFVFMVGLERASDVRVRAMMVILKFREELGVRYLRRGGVRSDVELRRLAEACRLNWKFMEEVGIIRWGEKGEIIVRV